MAKLFKFAHHTILFMYIISAYSIAQPFWRIIHASIYRAYASSRRARAHIMQIVYPSPRAQDVAMGLLAKYANFRNLPTSHPAAILQLARHRHRRKKQYRVYTLRAPYDRKSRASGGFICINDEQIAAAARRRRRSSDGDIVYALVMLRLILPPSNPPREHDEPIAQREIYVRYMRAHFFYCLPAGCVFNTRNHCEYQKQFIKMLIHISSKFARSTTMWVFFLLLYIAQTRLRHLLTIHTTYYI